MQEKTGINIKSEETEAKEFIEMFKKLDASEKTTVKGIMIGFDIIRETKKEAPVCSS